MRWLCGCLQRGPPKCQRQHETKHEGACLKTQLDNVDGGWHHWAIRDWNWYLDCEREVMERGSALKGLAWIAGSYGHLYKGPIGKDCGAAALPLCIGIPSMDWRNLLHSRSFGTGLHWLVPVMSSDSIKQGGSAELGLDPQPWLHSPCLLPLCSELYSQKQKWTP